MGMLALAPVILQQVSPHFPAAGSPVLLHLKQENLIPSFLTGKSPGMPKKMYYLGKCLKRCE